MDIPAPVQTVGRRSAADDEAGPLRLARLDVAAHPRLLALRDERTDVGDAVRRIPDHHRHHLGRQCVGEVAGAMGRDEDAGQGVAGLTTVGQAGRSDAGGDGARIGVVEDDRG